MEISNENQLPKINGNDNELSQILNSKPLEALALAFAETIKQSSENEAKRLLIQEQEIILETKELDLEVKKIDLLKHFDTSSKWYSLGAFVVGSLSVLGLHQLQALDKGNAQSLFTILLTVLIGGGLSSVKNFFDKNKTTP